jgi:hypothetical protein
MVWQMGGERDPVYGEVTLNQILHWIQKQTPSDTYVPYTLRLATNVLLEGDDRFVS